MASVKAKVLGQVSTVSASPLNHGADAQQVQKSPVKQLDDLREECAKLRQELKGLRGLNEEQTLELTRLKALVDDTSASVYRDAAERGREDGRKLYDEKLRELESRSQVGVEILHQLVTDSIEAERLFIRESLADTVALAVSRIIGDTRINPNYLADKICEIIDERRPANKVDVQLGEKLYELLRQSRLTFDRLSQMARVQTSAGLHPFEILVDIGDEVIDAGFVTQIRRIHELIAEYMA